MIAQLTVHLVWALAVATVVGYVVSRRRSEYLGPARWAYTLTSAGVGVVWLVLLGSIFSHDFRYTYVWGHSSRYLPLHLLLASSYAGQEGSLLLWALWLALVGFVVRSFARRLGWEAETMSLYAGVLAWMLLLLVAKNPFAFVWETYAEQGVMEGFLPAEGRGLNPLLHNYWIVIHPPVLFLGFTFVTVPFVLLLAGLWRGDSQRWAAVVLPWLGIAAAVLGLGIILGGLWAYETLGWGGFWAWDPVENSSLVPWLFTVAAVHTVLIQRRTGGLVRTTAVLVVLAFLTVLYSTFLTRSGVLGDTSVHSFVDPGFFAYVLLVVMMGIAGGLSGIFLLWRWKELGREALALPPNSRQFLLALGALGLVVSAIVVLVGTSYPLVAELVGRPKVAVEQRFYNLLHIPIGVWILLLNGISFVFQWRATPGGLVWRRLLLPLGATVAGTGLLWIGGIRDVWLLGLGASAWLTLVISGSFLFRGLRQNPPMAAALIAHGGLALLVLGVITLASLSWTAHVRLPQGEPIQLGAYRLTYIGRERIEQQYPDREKWRYAVSVETGTERAVLFPVLFWSDYNQRQAAFLEPGIGWRIAADFYVSPKSVEEVGGEVSEFVLRQGEVVPIDSLLQARLVRFQMGPVEGDTLTLFLWLELRSLHGRIDTLRLPTRMVSLEQTMPSWIAVGDSLEMAMLRFLPDRQDPARSQALVGIRRNRAAAREILTVEFSLKPGINLVWLGAALMVGGLFWAGVRRLRAAAQRTRRQRSAAAMQQHPASVAD